MIFNKFRKCIRVSNQEDELKGLTNDELIKSATRFFVSIGFTPVVFKSLGTSDRKKFIIFYPETIISERLWNDISMRYTRDSWSNNGGGMKIYFDKVALLDGNLVFIAGRNMTASMRPNNLTSSRIVVFSNSRKDNHPYAILYMYPTNAYTYAEWKDKKYVDNKPPIHKKMDDHENIYEFLLKNNDLMNDQ